MLKRIAAPLILIASMMLCFNLVRADANDGVPLRGFADVSLVHRVADDSDSFQIHDIDFFLAKPLDKKINFLIELNFQPGYAGVGVDAERAYVQYVVDNWLKVAVGRYHTALGYWNETFHHGSYLQTSATRPVMGRFEDTGGLLPAHQTGIELRGNGPVGGGNLGYIFDIGNGRPPVKDPPAFYYNYNKTKSFNGLIYYEFVNGLRFGANFYVSDLPGGFTKDGGGNSTSTSGPKGKEVIGGAHLVYNSPDVEWFTEYEHMTHTYVAGTHTITTNLDGTTNDLGLAPTTNLDLLYSQFGYHLGKFTPYARFELDSTSDVDAYLNAQPDSGSPGLLATTRNYVVGTRYEFTPASALKFEVTYIKSDASIGAQMRIPDVDPNRHETVLTELNWSYGW